MQKHLTLLVLTLIAAALAGTAAAVLVSNSLERYAETLLNDRRFAALTPITHSAAPSTLEEALLGVREVQLNATAFFVDAENSASVGANVVQGQGIVIGADGWIVTDAAQLARYATRTGTYEGFAAVQSGKTYAIDRVVKDTQTSAVAIRVQNAQGWTPVELAESDEVLPGGTIFGLGESGEVMTAFTVLRASVTSVPQVPADEPDAQWRIAGSFAEGVPVLTTQSRLFGFTTGEGTVMPAQALRPFIRQALRGATTITHAGLGMRIVDLSLPSTLAPEVTQNYNEGALIMAAAGERTGIIKGSPADSAGLTDGDIILAIDDVRITSTITCADILATYAPGQEVALRVARSGEVQEMQVTLGTWEELIY